MDTFREIRTPARAYPLVFWPTARLPGAEEVIAAFTSDGPILHLQDAAERVAATGDEELLREVVAKAHTLKYPLNNLGIMASAARHGQKNLALHYAGVLTEGMDRDRTVEVLTALAAAAAEGQRDELMELALLDCPAQASIQDAVVLGAIASDDEDWANKVFHRRPCSTVGLCDVQYLADIHEMARLAMSAGRVLAKRVEPH